MPIVLLQDVRKRRKCSRQTPALVPRRGRWAIAVLVLTGVLLAMSTEPAAAQTPIQISLSPLAIELHGERGASVPFAISIINNSRFHTARFTVRAEGLREGRSGDYGPKMPDDGPYAASSWVHFEQDQFEVAPGATHALRGTVAIPRNAGPSGYAAVVVELLPEELIGEAALSVEYIQQFVTALEIVVGRRHVRSAHIESMAVIPTAAVPELAATYGTGAVIFSGTLVNDGDIHIIGRGRLILRDERGRRVREVPLGGGRGVVLPDTVVDFGSVLGGLAPGDYEMQAIVDYGGSRPAVGRMEFTLTDEAVGVSQIVAGRAVRIDAGPDTLVYEFPRHGYRAQTVTVVNRDSVDVDFTVTLAELVKDESGESVVAEPDVVMPYSAVPWGDVRPASFTLRPGQRRNVVVGFRVPEGELGGRYAQVLIEGIMPSPEPGLEAARSEISVDSLLMLGTDFTPRMTLSEVEWRAVGNTRTVSIGATIVNQGDIHGSVAMRLSLLEHTPEQEEDMGDFIFVTGEQWDIVDSVDVEVENLVLLPGQGYFLFGTFGRALETRRQYQVLIELTGQGGTRDATSSLELWLDEDGNVHEGVMEHMTGDDGA